MGTSLNHRHLVLLLLLLCILLHLSPTSHAQEVLPNITYTFSSFNDSNGGFNFSSDASANKGALQITPDTGNEIDEYLVNKSGRVLLNYPFKLWQYQANSNATTKLIASFNTSFSINIYRPDNTTPGEGFAFLIAPDLDGPPIKSYGGYIGLTNSTIDGNASNHVVAIELDTVKQVYDPDANHIGLDINSVVSKVTSSLTPLGIEIAPVKPTNYTVWIDYDGAHRHLWVYMTFQNHPKPAASVLNASLDLSDHILQTSYIGFAASTGSDYQLNCVLAWNLTVEKLPEDRDESDIPSWQWFLMVGLPLVAVTVILGVVVGIYARRRKVDQDDPSVLAGTLKSLPGTPREFQFKLLRKATNNFDEGMKLGQGGFGIVYKGVIPGENTEVAVKKFSRGNMKSQDDFLAELTIINRLRHKHLVRLLGWCHKKGMLLLVYEYMPNGSLDQHLFGCRPLLNWHHRYNILTGVASALHYLHDEFDQKVVHRDLKASNVLLDSNFNARLGDFGLARALDTDKTSYTDIDIGGVPGTMGYIAPECFHTGKATRESDVFAFGAIVLEVVCGRRPRCDIGGFQFLADWVWKLYREERIMEAVDPWLGGEFVEEDALRLLLLGLACSHPVPKKRPNTAAIVQIVSKSVAHPVVPPFKPAFVWPAGPFGDEDSSSRVSSTVASSSYYASSSEWTPRGSDM